MLEEKEYSFQEMCTILESKSKKSIDNKLKRYNVIFHSTGRSPRLTYTIEKVNDPFKVFCITEVGFDPRTNFDHLRHFSYHFFCDDYYMSMPDERKEKMMNSYDHHISRKTIANYEKRYAEANYISRGGEYYYYFAYKENVTMTSRETYLKAWHYYWYLKNEYGEDGLGAMLNVIRKYGGAPRKQPIIQKNAFTLKKVDELVRLIGDSIEKELINKEKELE